MVEAKFLVMTGLMKDRCLFLCQGESLLKANLHRDYRRQDKNTEVRFGSRYGCSLVAYAKEQPWSLYWYSKQHL